MNKLLYCSKELLFVTQCGREHVGDHVDVSCSGIAHGGTDRHQL